MRDLPRDYDGDLLRAVYAAASAMSAAPYEILDIACEQLSRLAADTGYSLVVVIAANGKVALLDAVASTAREHALPLPSEVVRAARAAARNPRP